MPENNDMESLIQKKMEEFRLEPREADWDAIYEKLHPKKDRRFIFWILPIFGILLLGGGYWMVSQNQQSKAGSESKLTQKITFENKEEAEKTVALTESADKKENTTATNKTINEPQAKATPATEIDNRIKATRPRGFAAAKKQDRQSENSKKSLEAQKQYQELKQQNPVAIVATMEEKTAEKIAATLPDNAHQQHAQQLAVDSALVEQKQAQQPAMDSTAGKKSTEPEAVKKSEPAKNIPNMSNHGQKGWYLGVYAGAGLNKPTEPMQFAKAMDLNSSSPSTGGSSTSIITNQVSKNNGIHLATGLSLERKLKKASFSLGLGLQYNAWSASSVTYRDSVSFAGSFYNRALVSNNHTEFKHIGLEVPVMVNFRLFGKSKSSFWLSTGLNNLFTIDFKQQTEMSMAFNNATANTDQSADANTYIPQLRFGLMYENASQKNHWQISPFLQYGLGSLSASGQADIQTLNFGIQARYYFKRLSK